LKWTEAELSVAVYNPTGIETKPKPRESDAIDLGAAMLFSLSREQ